MAPEDFTGKLATLSRRQRAVLRLRCQGMDYRAIGQELHIKLGTVKSTMAEVYVKLDLDDLATSERHKVLFQEVCTALASEALPDPPPESEEEPAPSPRVMELVEIDERALMVVEARPLVVPPQPHREGRRPMPVIGLLLLVMVVVALGVFGGLVAYRLLFGEDRREMATILPEDPPFASSTPHEAPQQQATAPPATQPPTSTSEPTLTPEPTSTPPPTDTPPPTMTAIPMPTATPVGMVGQVHQVSGEKSGTATGDGGQASASSWYSSGVYVQAGDRLSVTYLGGEWWIGRTQNNEWWPQTPTDAGGYTGREGDRALAELMVNDPNLCFELRSAPIGSLIGRIGENGPAFSIGNTYDEVVQLTGILFLRINYNSRVNYAFHFEGECPITNGGVVTVRVQVTPP